MAIAKKNSACRLSTVVFVGFLQTVCPYRSEDEVDNLLQAMDTESTDENVTQGASELEKSNQSRPFSQKILDEQRSLIVGKECGGGGGAMAMVTDTCFPWKNAECLEEKCWCREMHFYDPGYPACKACCVGRKDGKFSWGTETAQYWGCAAGHRGLSWEEAGRDGDVCVDTSAQEGRNTPDTGRDCSFGDAHGQASFRTDGIVSWLGGKEGKKVALSPSVDLGHCLPALNTHCNAQKKCECDPGYFHDENTDACKQCCVYEQSYTWGSGVAYGCSGKYTPAPDGAHCR